MSRLTRTRRLTVETLEARIQPAGLKVALISDAVAQAEQVQAAAANGVVAITYDAATATLNGLVDLLQSVSASNGGAKISHLGLVAHGRSGAVNIGPLDTLDSQDVATPSAEWAQLRELLTPNARLDLYSCGVAAGKAGKAFVRELANVTGADIYASTDGVGTVRGADFVWEFNTGVRGESSLFRMGAMKQIGGLSLEDLFEENDSIGVTSTRPEGATNSPNFGPVVGGKTIRASMEDEGDYYRFTTLGPATDAHFVSVSHSATTANVDMALFDASGNDIQYSQSGGSTDSISLYGLASGTYYVLVYPRNAGVFGTVYDLHIQAPQDTSDDLFEPNSTIAQVNAQPLAGTNSPNLGAVTGSRTISNLVQDDNLGADYFRFTTLGPGKREHFVSIEFNEAEGNLDLALFDASGTDIQYSQNGSGSDKISLYGLPSGTYYVLAYSRTASRPALQSYDLQINAPLDTSDDPFESNNSISQVDSQPVGTATSPNLGVVAGSRTFLGLVQDDSTGYDFFKFTTTATGTDQHFVSIAFDAEHGNLDLALFDSVGNDLIYSQSGGDTDSITMNGRPAGTYYVLAYSRTATRPAMVSYDLEIKVPGTGLGIVGSPIITEGDGGLKNAVFTVTRSDSAGTASVDYQTDDGSATLANQDYQSTSGTLNFGVGETSKTITVPVKGDTADEPDETFFVNLFNANGVSLNTSQAIGTILNDDSAGILQFSAPTYSVSESAGTAFIKVTRVGGSDGQVTVDYATNDGSAVSPDDYGSATGTITFNNGEVSKTISVPIVNDTESEPSETVNLILTNPTGGATLGGQTDAELTILANDLNPGKFQFSLAEYNVNENAGSATIEVQRVGGDDGIVSVKYSTFNKTALSGSDYTAETAVLTFQDGETTQTFQVEILDDNVYEALEYLNVSLSAPTGGAKLGAPRTAKLNILNDDALMSKGTIVVGDGKTGVVKIVNGTTGAIKTTIQAFPVGFNAGVRVATGDVNGDTFPDIIAAGGPNGSTNVRVFSGLDGVKLPGNLGEFAHGFAATEGIHVAAGDLSGDGKAEIILTAAGAGGGPHVKVYDGDTRVLSSEFDAFPGSTQIASVAIGDVMGTTAKEIIVGIGGAGTPGQVKVFSPAGIELNSINLPAATTGGISLATGDVNGDSKADIIVGSGPGAGPHVKVFSATGVGGAELQTLPPPYGTTFKGGVRVAVGDVDGDGIVDLITAGGKGPKQKLKIIDFGTGLAIRSISAGSSAGTWIAVVE